MNQLNIETYNQNLFDISESKLHKCGILYIYGKYYIHKNKENYIKLLVENIEKTIKISEKYNSLECIFYIDLNNLKLKDYDISFFKIIIKLVQEQYPSSLGKMIFVNVPIFVKTIYSLLKKMVSEDCRKKIFFEKKNKSKVFYTNTIDDIDK